MMKQRKRKMKVACFKIYKMFCKDSSKTSLTNNLKYVCRYIIGSKRKEFERMCLLVMFDIYDICVFL